MNDKSTALIEETITDVLIEPFDLEEPFEELATRFAHEAGTVALLSGGDLDCARYHILGVWPWLTLCAGIHNAQLTIDGLTRTVHADPFDVLQQVLRKLRLPAKAYPQPIAAGVMGYLSYDLKDALECLPRTSMADLDLPHMLFYGHSLVVVHDRQTRKTRLAVPVRERMQVRPHELIQRFVEQVAMALPDKKGFDISSRRRKSNFTQTAYEASVQQIIDYIGAGDVYQVNLSQRFQAPFKGDAFALFRHFLGLNPAPFYAFIQAGDHQIVSTSPERFLLQNGRQVETRPIKGTRPRGQTPDQDEVLRQKLVQSPKDDAELSMIVDLLRNDIGKVCQAGSVHVAEHKRVEAYQNVYHLVSVVKGDLDDGVDSVDLVKATFPGGSITGCPKVRAMQVIDELESCRRHVYCGSIGYLSFHDTMDLSIAIRTATIADDTIYFSVGGGVVYDSRPRTEYEETLHKGRTLMSTHPSGQAPAATDPVVWCNGRLQPAAEATVSVTDQGLQYGYGFFETIRVDAGTAPLLAAHLDRFARSWQVLMPGPVPDVSWKVVVDQVLAANELQQGCAAVKILATRGSRIRAPWDHTLLVMARPYTHRLAGIKGRGIRLGTYPESRQTPLADHKTLNYLYYLLAGQWARQNGWDEALILNPDGSVSETNTANLLLLNGREVIRPASPAVLPGVMAATLSEKLSAWGYAVSQGTVSPGQLHSADQVLVANALMGAVPVINIDGAPRPEGGDLWRRLNDAIIPGWSDHM